MTLEQFVEQSRAALGKRLKSVVLYGSGASGDVVKGVSNYDLLVVVEPLTATELDALMPVVANWTKSGHPAPQFFGPAQLAASADTFPIELSDMRQSRKVLFGTDLLVGLEINRQDLRLQLERELKGKLLSLRRKYVLTAGRADAVIALLIGSYSSFAVLGRAALRLFEEDVPIQKLEAMQRLQTHISFDAQPFLKIGELQQRRTPTVASPKELFAAYLKSIETIVSAVDRLPHPSE